MTIGEALDELKGMIVVSNTGDRQTLGNLYAPQFNAIERAIVEKIIEEKLADLEAVRKALPTLLRRAA